jgi:PAS domain S-box-containing protein
MNKKIKEENQILESRRKNPEGEKDRLQKILQSLWNVVSMVDADYRTLCDYALNEIVHLTQSQYGFFGFLSENEDELMLQSWSREVMGNCKIQDKPFIFPTDRAGIWADAVRERKIVIVNDYQKYVGKKGLPEGHVPLTRLLIVPVFSGDQIVSLAAVANKATEYTEEDAELINTFMANIQVILDKKRIEDTYKTVIENTGTAMVIIEEDATVSFANKEIENLLGCPKEEVVGKRWMELLSEGELDRLMKYHRLRGIDPNLVPRSYEAEFTDKNRNLRNVLLTVSIIPGTKRRVVSIIDITELREAERKLRESEERYRILFEKSPYAVLLVGLDTKILDCNEAASNLIGLSKEEIIGKSFTELGVINEKDFPSIMELFYRAMREDVGKVEVKIRSGNEFRWLEAYPTLLRRNDEPYAFQIILRDITDQKKAEEELKTSLERLRILHEVDFGIITGKTFNETVKSALQNVREFVRCETTALLTYDPKSSKVELLAVDADKFVFEGVVRFSFTLDRSAEEIERGETVKIDDILDLRELTDLEKELLKAGLRSYIMVPLIVKDVLIGILALSSKKPRAFDEKLDFLKEISNQLAIALHEARLFEMKKKAFEQIDQNIEQFAILVDHLRNPLAAISGYTELYIVDEGKSIKIQEQIKRIEKVIKKLERGWLESEDIREFLRRSYE